MTKSNDISKCAIDELKVEIINCVLNVYFCHIPFKYEFNKNYFMVRVPAVLKGNNLNCQSDASKSLSGWG